MSDGEDTEPIAERIIPEGPRSPGRRRRPSRSRSRSRSPDRRISQRRSRSRSPARRDSERRNRSPRPRQRRNDGGFRWKEKRRDDDDRGEQRLQRGYRERDQPRPRSPRREPERNRDKNELPRAGNNGEKKPAPPLRAYAPPAEPMIIVNVNDRLGTKAAIRCLASDSIKLFKAQVAAQIGRQPHEIMLKRQGERPFKDALTLEDYGVGNGVQLDLEVDTGD